MNRSITSRNLAGGFLGGMFGILISWYMSPMALPLGVLLGVVIGWWAEDIVRMFVHSFNVACCLWRAIVTRIVPEEILLSHRGFVERLKAFLGAYVTKFGNGISRALGRAVIFFRSLKMMVWALVSVPVQFVQWASHPSSMALLIIIGASVVGLAINALAIGMLWPWPEMKMIGGGFSGEPLQLVPFTFSNVVVYSSIAAFILSSAGMLGVIAKNFEDNRMRNFYARWEQYSKYSPVTYFAQVLYQFFKSQIIICGFYVLMIVYWVTLGGVLIAFVTIPVATIITFMIGLYKIARRSAHWWCLGVTLIVTGLSVLFFHNSFSNEALLWTVALCTGAASGVATEGLRLLGIWWGNTAMGQYYLDVWEDGNKTLPFSIAVPAWRTISRTSDNMVPWMLRG